MNQPSNQHQVDCSRPAAARRWRAAMLVCGLVVAVVAGCQRSGTRLELADPAQLQRSGEEILDLMRCAYADAQLYSDQARLWLTYRLGNRLIEEPHDWSTTFVRPHDMAIRLFQARIESTASELSCFVYDFPSGNLDQQCLTIPAADGLPLDALYQDDVARPFITGATELPIDPAQPFGDRLLLPPPVALLGGKHPIEWLENARVQRVDDGTEEECPCFRIAVASRGREFFIWIDQQDYLIRRIEFPIELLDRTARRSEEISDLKLFAEFTGARFGQPQTGSLTPEPSHTERKRVARFIKVPESFPCELIGHRVPDQHVWSIDEQAVALSRIAGGQNLLFWLDQSPASSSVIEQLSELRSRCSPQGPPMYVIAVPSGDPPTAEDEAWIAAMEEQIRDSAQLFLDPGFAAGSAMQLRVLPVVLALDSSARVQYVRHVEGIEWMDELIQAAERISQGADLAGEMRREYSAFVDNYHRQLAAAQKAVTSPDRNGAAPPKVMNLHPEHIFRNNDFQMAGNMVATVGEGETLLWILDGWQTVAQMDAHGKVRSRIKLPVGPGDAISVLRAARGQGTPTRFAGFSAGGNKVWVFDEKWRELLVHTLPRPAVVHDVCFADLDGDQSVELNIASSVGIEQVMLDGTRRCNRLAAAAATSLAPISPGDATGLLFTTADGLLWSTDSSSSAPRPESFSSSNRSMIRIAGAQHVGPQWCAIIESANQHWRVEVGADAQKPSAYCSILKPGDASPLEFVCSVCQDNGTVIWGIAAADGALYLLSTDGRQARLSFPVDQPIGGVQLLAADQGLVIVIARGATVDGWLLRDGLPVKY